MDEGGRCLTVPVPRDPHPAVRVRHVHAQGGRHHRQHPHQVLHPSPALQVRPWGLAGKSFSFRDSGKRLGSVPQPLQPCLFLGPCGFCPVPPDHCGLSLVPMAPALWTPDSCAPSLIPVAPAWPFLCPFLGPYGSSPADPHGPQVPSSIPMAPSWPPWLHAHSLVLVAPAQHPPVSPWLHPLTPYLFLCPCGSIP